MRRQLASPARDGSSTMEETLGNAIWTVPKNTDSTRTSVGCSYPRTGCSSGKIDTTKLGPNGTLKQTSLWRTISGTQGLQIRVRSKMLLTIFGSDNCGTWHPYIAVFHVEPMPEIEKLCHINSRSYMPHNIISSIFEQSYTLRWRLDPIAPSLGYRPVYLYANHG